MEKSLSKDTNCVTMNKLKLSEDASKIVQAMKKLHVPNTMVTEGSEIGNGKRKLKLSNGVQVSYSDDNVPNKLDSARFILQVMNNTSSTVASGIVSKVGSDKDVDVRKAVTGAQENGQGKVEGEEILSQNDSCKSEESLVLHKSACSSGSETHLNTTTHSLNNKSCLKISLNASSKCLVEKNGFRIEQNVDVSDLTDGTNLTSLKCNSPVVFESTAKEEGMQKAVSKVVEKLLNELPTSEDIMGEVPVVKSSNGTDRKLFAELTKDTNKRQKCESDNDKNRVEEKEISVHSELKMKIDLKRKQANYIETDDKPPDILTVKKVKIDSEVLHDEEKKAACLRKELKVQEKKEEKVKITRLRNKELFSEVEKLAKKLLSKQTSTEIGELKTKIATLENKVYFWKRQYFLLQKEVTECNISVQRTSQNLKRNMPVPSVKVSTRCVGLQVQQVHIPTVRTPLNLNRPSTTTSVVPSMIAKRQDLTAIAPSTLTSIAPTKIPTATLVPATVTPPKLHPSLSVSILQPKPQTNISLPSNLLVTSTGNSIIPKVASVVPPTTVATVRSTLDLQRKVQMEVEDLKSETSKSENMSQKQDLKMSSMPSQADERQFVIVPQTVRRTTNDWRKHRASPATSNLPSAHTISLTAAALRIFRRFLVSEGEIKEIIALSTTKLNSYLARFFAAGKKKDGTDYGANTLTCVFDSIERHLRMHNYPASVKRDEVFHTARENLRLKRRQLQKKKQTGKCISYYENGKFRTRSWKELAQAVPVQVPAQVQVQLQVPAQVPVPVLVKKSDHFLSNTQSIDDIKLFTSWKNGAPLNDLRALFHLDVCTLNAYLAQFFIWIHQDEMGEAINSNRLQRFHNTLDEYMKELSYPMSVKCNTFFRHSLECKVLKEKLLDGELEKNCEMKMLDKSEVEEDNDEDEDADVETSDNEDTDRLRRVLEPEVSLVEDDKEIILDVESCKTAATGMLNTFLESSEVKQKGDIMKIPPDSLDDLLANFYVNSAINMDAIELIDFHQSINKYLRESGYPLSIEDDPDFAYSQLCLSSRQAFLLRLIELPEKMFISQLNCLSRLGAVGITDPVALLCCLWCHISHEFLLGASLDHAQLQWSQVQLKKDTSNKECLVYKGKMLKKLGMEFSNICPVEAYKVLMKHRPCSSTEHCNGCKNLYLCLSSEYSWFCCKELSRGQLELIAHYVDDVMDAMKNRTGAELQVSQLKHELFKELLKEQEEIVADDASELHNRTVLTDQKVKEVFVAGGHAPNTIIKTMHDVNVFRDWLSSNGFQKNFASVSASTLNRMLLKFFGNLKKRDGSDYEPNSLNSIYFSIDRFLRVQQYPANIKSDSTFLECRNFFSVKRKEYDADKDPVHIVQRRQVDISFTDDDIECLRKKKLVGFFNPEAMLLALWHMNTVVLGIHSQRAQLHMLWGDFQLLKEPDGREFVEYHQCATKAKLISCPPNGMSALINKKPLKAYATPDKLESCPVQLFKKFHQSRPPMLLNGNSRFYLYPADGNCTFWFRDSPLGRSKFASLPATIWKLIHEAREELKSKRVAEVEQIPRMIVHKQAINQPSTSDATKMKNESRPSISLIPLFPTQSSVNKLEKIEHTLMPTQNVVLLPVVNTPTSANVVQIIPLISTIASQQLQRNSTLF